MPLPSQQGTSDLDLPVRSHVESLTSELDDLFDNKRRTSLLEDDR